VDQLEVEKQDGGDPVIYRCVGLDIWVVKHPANIEGIHLHHEFADANEVEAHYMERAE
jgi:hypothetical protein